MTSCILCGNTYSIAAVFPGVKCGQILIFSVFIILFDREEMAIDEAELEPIEMAEKLHAQQILQEQLRKQLEEANFDISASILSSKQIQEIIQK